MLKINHYRFYLIHNVFGIICLSNILYHNLFFNIYKLSSEISTLLLICHIAIPISSYIFNVKKDNINYKITEHYISYSKRYGILIHSLRIVSIMWYPKYCYILTILYLLIYKVRLIFYNNSNQLINPYIKYPIIIKSKVLKCINKIYSIASLVISSGLIINVIDSRLLFMTLRPLQILPFNYLLIQKKILNKHIHSITIFIMQLEVYIYWYYLYNNFYLFFLSVLIYILIRFNIPESLIWITLFFIDILYKNNHLFCLNNSLYCSEQYGLL